MTSKIIFTSLIYFTLYAKAQFQAYDPPNWLVEANASVTENYFFYSISCAGIVNHHHAVGLALGNAPTFWETKRFSPGAGIDYCYYFRPLGHVRFNPLLTTSVDYNCYTAHHSDYDVLRNILYEDQTRVDYLYWHAGAGVSMRFSRNFVVRASVSYILAKYYYQQQSGRTRRGENYSDTYSGVYFPASHEEFPFLLKLSLGKLIR